jgi:hypothetical protein
MPVKALASPVVADEDYLSTLFKDSTFYVLVIIYSH